MKSKKSYGFKGKYCTLCHSVWELIPSVGIVKHPDFPSYGLERQYCSTCSQSLPKTEATTAEERHKQLLQKIADENKELFKNKSK